MIKKPSGMERLHTGTSRGGRRRREDEFIKAADGRAADLYTASASFGPSLDAGMSTSTTKLDVIESETSADELALDDDDISKPVSKRVRKITSRPGGKDRQ